MLAGLNQQKAELTNSAERQGLSAREAREKLAAKLEEGARKAAEDAEVKEQAREAKVAKSKEAAKEDDGGIVKDVVSSSAFKDFVRTAAREIARGMFSSGRR